MDPIITSFATTGPTTTTTASPRDESDAPITPGSYHYKKVHVPLAYPSEAIQQSTTKTYVYPPLMSPSDDAFYKSALPSQATPPTSASNSSCSASVAFSTQPINIPSSNASRSRERESGRFGGRPLRSSASFPNSRLGSLPNMSLLPSSPVQQQPMPSPPPSPWKRSNSFTRPSVHRSATLIVDETPYPDLPAEVRAWSSAHVAEYLGYSLRRYPRAITEDLGRYVRQTACLNGAQFLDLSEEDLERMEINLKWRSMIMKAVGMLRRETLRASRVVSMNWEDGYDPEKDDGAQTVSPGPSSPIHSDEEDRSISHSASATTSSDSTHSQETSQSQTQSHNRRSIVLSSFTTTDNNSSTMENTKVQPVDAQELRRGIVEDISSILLSWKKDQEVALAKKATESSSTIGGLGFMEGVVIGGLIVAFMMRFAR
ncbi:hypothetical protein EC957_008621 [Mortierella hygrophila]|uniref:SAM domain-containing protein n=1 Tax=Mortierella hygrophila TaxID=979708 RepID=A0A9P6EXM3_9FUNG|nr:hypothetical protein EC957_008621 [Mortierella hygrophila]